jgi:DNA polymerase-4
MIRQRHVVVAGACEHAFVPAEATILHADLDSFYASVEQRDNPELRGKPVLVGGGVVVAASYEAKALGIHAPMNGAAALRICPHAAVVPPRMTAYAEASKDVFAVFDETSPSVEGISIDEAFLDVGGMEHFAGSPREIAQQLRADVLEQVGLPITVGVASTKFLAKVASGFAKPDGLLVIEPGRELEFLHPLAIERLWGVGPVTSKKLRAYGIKTVGDIARIGEDALGAMLGQGTAKHLSSLANNQDPRPVRARGRRRSIGAQRAIRRQERTHAELEAMLVALVDRIAGRLRKSGRSTRTVVLSLRFGDFTRATRSHTIGNATSQSAILLATARELLSAAMPDIQQKGITLIGVSFDNLDDGEVQLELPFENHEEDDIDATVDAVRDRFGKDAITRGVLVGKDEGMSAPVLPD